MYLCCWNTSYCSQQCQKNHWPIHMARCEQLRRPSNLRPTAAAAAVPIRSAQAPTQVAAAIPFSSSSLANAPPSFSLVPRVPVPVSQPNSVHNAIIIHYNEESNQRQFMEPRGMPITSTAPEVTRTTLRSPLPPVTHSGRKEWELANRGTRSTNFKDPRILPPPPHDSMSSILMAANATSRPHTSFTQPTASELYKPSNTRNASSRAGQC